MVIRGWGFNATTGVLYYKVGGKIIGTIKHKYITYEDIECNCGCGTYILADGLEPMIDKLTNYLRHHFHRRVKPLIHCMCRCEYHNEEVGGTKRSQHLKGRAADLHYPGVKIEDLHAACRAVHYKHHILGGGLGYYKTFIHIDVGRFRTWGTPLEGGHACGGFWGMLSKLFRRAT